jgi:hypothetical protein
MKAILVAKLVSVSAIGVAAAALASAPAFAAATTADHTDSSLVSTDADSLLSFAVSQGQESFGQEDNVREFLTCFVANMDLPAQVYADCAIKLVQAGVACKDGAMNESCITAGFQVAQKCALPVKRAIDGAKTCMAEGK